MKITNRELVSTEEIIDITVEINNESHCFRAVVWENPDRKFVAEINYLDKYEKPLKNSEKRKIKEFIKNSLLEEVK